MSTITSPQQRADQLAEALQLVMLLRIGLREDHRVLDRTPAPAQANPFGLAYLRPGHYYRLADEPVPAARRRSAKVRHPIAIQVSDLSSAGPWDFVLDALVEPSQLATTVGQIADVLAPRGAWVGAVPRGEPSRHMLSGLLGQHGMSVTFVAVPPTLGCRWFVATRQPASGRPLIDLGLTSWMDVLAESSQQTLNESRPPTRCGMI
ncbi:hypothetical protein FHR83_005600 [Actinoplanes campanulatus]|uniref:Methyltransferase domain-containing protein n=1 Tax=Actinoplanes campanulatus TaxID=113559 RepID=A0A7W5FGU7_9ACTN|nr:hypothetical protein [Actinoplanes campanulatus]MBB3097916.1 hypothetical protein [Actinoplanes campanulatus]GGN22761.1 hypothetical protein GCM10010109_37460 [Actinoplanes campanulatus]GID34605.1 hypothetical protein Aca09nite_11110 [Actinoplanes campanulatus]